MTQEMNFHYVRVSRLDLEAQSFRPLNQALSELRRERNDILARVRAKQNSLAGLIEDLLLKDVSFRETVQSVREHGAFFARSSDAFSRVIRAFSKHGVEVLDSFNHKRLRCIECREDLKALQQKIPEFSLVGKKFQRDFSALIAATNSYTSSLEALMKVLSEQQGVEPHAGAMRSKLVGKVSALLLTIKDTSAILTLEEKLTSREEVLAFGEEARQLLQSRDSLIEEEKRLTLKKRVGTCSNELEKSAVISHSRFPLQKLIFKWNFFHEQREVHASNPSLLTEYDREEESCIKEASSYSSAQINRAVLSLERYLTSEVIESFRHRLKAWDRAECRVVGARRNSHGKHEATVHLFHEEKHAPFLEWLADRPHTERQEVTKLLTSLRSGYCPSSLSMRYNLRPGVSEIKLGALRLYVAVNREQSDWLILGGGEKLNDKTQTQDIEDADLRFRRYLDRRLEWRKWEFSS